MVRYAAGSEVAQRGHTMWSRPELVAATSAARGARLPKSVTPAGRGRRAVQYVRKYPLQGQSSRRRIPARLTGVLRCERGSTCGNGLETYPADATQPASCHDMLASDAFGVARHGDGSLPSRRPLSGCSRDDAPTIFADCGSIGG